MKYLAKYGYVQFAIALIVFGIQHIIVQRFIIGEPTPWPASIPGGPVWAYISGLFLICTGIMLLLRKNAVPFLMITGLMIFIWAFVRDLPGIMHPIRDWLLTRMGEALALTGSCFIIADSLEQQNRGVIKGSFFIRTEKLLPAGPTLIAIFFLICGVQHFMLSQYVRLLVPAWIPGDIYWTYFAGTALIAGGIGLMYKRVQKLAAFWSGLMLFLWMLMLHAPHVVNSINDRNEWNSLIQTAAISGALFVLAVGVEKKNGS